MKYDLYHVDKQRQADSGSKMGVVCVEPHTKVNTFHGLEHYQVHFLFECSLNKAKCLWVRVDLIGW